jgi:hypothetical protein
MDGAETTTLSCAECGRKPRLDETADDEWRAYRDVDDDLPVFCPECAEREFGVRCVVPAARRKAWRSCSFIRGRA